ncbi:MAG: hypothetical protein Q4D44_03310 [Eubacteriales bacterium]|nr:hypothetical protein [Eubacteriales bacterium]
MRIKSKSKKSLEASSLWILPFTALSGIMLMLSYILEIIGGGNISENLGEVTVFGRLFLGISRLLEELLLPVISGLTALKIAAPKALPAGVLGGYLTAVGYSFLNPFGGLSSTTGIFGAVVSGVTAGYLTEVFEKLSGRITDRYLREFSVSVLGTLSTILFSMGINTVWGIASYYLSFPLGYLATVSSPLVYFILGILINLNPGSAFYVSAISVFGTMSALGTGNATGALFTALGVPVVSLFISALASPEDFSKPEWFTYIFGVLLGFGGIGVTAVPYYVKHPLRASVCFSLGGAMASLLSLQYDIGTTGITGGFLGANSENPILLGLIILCSAFFSSTVNAVWGYFENPNRYKKYNVFSYESTKKASD